jgi:hypothetical protein
LGVAAFEERLVFDVRYIIVLFGILLLASPALAAPPGATPVPSTDSASGGFDPPATPAPGPPSAPHVLVVPGGTHVDVSLTEPVSSANANVGDTVTIVVDHNVDVGGYIVIPKGSNGQATVAQVDHAGGNGHGGKLGLTMDWVYSADHGKILLSNIDHSTGDDTDKKGAASTATILSYVFLGPVGLFAHNFVRGKDVTIDTTKVFTVFVDHDIHVAAMQKEELAGFDQ